MRSSDFFHSCITNLARQKLFACKAECATVPVMAARRPTSFRLTAQALRLLAQLAARSGISQAACLELAIRKLAKREGVEFKQA